MFGVTILGNNSALPAYDRHPTAQVVTLYGHSFLIDCGEGTQLQMSRYKVRRSRIGHIFISHLHGDHYFGLMGLLTSMGLLGRKDGIHLYAPPELDEIIRVQLAASDTELPFPLHFHPLTREEVLVDHRKFSVECFATRHRIPCWGFLIREKKAPRRISREKIAGLNIPSWFYDRLKNGEDYTDQEGTLIPNESVTVANTPARSYAYCADTLFDEELPAKIKDASLLYHETTYLKDLPERAMARFHSTTVQAAEIARRSMAGRLLIGHFSSKYEELDPFLEETRALFARTELAVEGATYLVEPAPPIPLPEK